MDLISLFASQLMTNQMNTENFGGLTEENLTFKTVLKRDRDQT